MRVISCIVNGASSSFSEGVATAEDIDQAMKLGTNYPREPFEWAEEIGASSRPETLDALRLARGDAYLTPPEKRRHGPAGLQLKQTPGYQGIVSALPMAETERC